MLGPELVEATADEDVHNAEGNPSTAAPSALALDMATSSTQGSKEEGVNLVTGPRP